MAALASSQFNAGIRIKATLAAEAKAEKSKNAAAGVTQSMLKKKRKAERNAEKVRERAALQLQVQQSAQQEQVEMEDDAEERERTEEVRVGSTLGKRAREERQRRKGTIPYAPGEKILLVGEGKSHAPRPLVLMRSLNSFRNPSFTQGISPLLIRYCNSLPLS